MAEFSAVYSDGAERSLSKCHLDKRMNFSLLELQRARRMLEEYCARQNSLASGSGRQIRCCQDSTEIYIGDSDPIRPIVKLRYEGRGWLVFVRLESGDWRPYPHLPHTGDLQAVIDELEQAPLHVHWD